MPLLSSSPGPESVGSVEITSWWLRAPLDEDLDTAVRVESWDKRKLKESATFTVSGRDKPVVLRGTVNAIAGTLVVRTQSEEEYDAVEALIDAGQTLLLQNVIGEQWYLEVTGEVPVPQRLASPTATEAYPVRHLHNWSIPLTEVDAPA
jgi:hypothetical protein